MTDWRACVALCVVVTIVLNGSESGKSTTTTTTTTTPKLPPPPAPGNPWDGRLLAALMNQEYHSYNPSDMSSGKGIYLRMTEEISIYCGGKCYGGKPDCKISGSILNDKQMIDHVKGTIAPTFGKATAWYINTTKVFTKLGKCSFAWDGGTDNKVNGGCGCNLGEKPDCSNPNAAYYDKCGGVPCTDKSPDVTRCECTNMDKSKWPVDWGNAPVCFWKGPAFYPPKGMVPDETHEMLDWRVQHQTAVGSKPHTDQYTYWNEMVLDGGLLLEEMAKDPFGTLPAIVYFPSVHGEKYGRDKARELVAELKKKYNQHLPIPIIKVEETVDVVRGANPFLFDPADQVDFEETIV